MKNAELSYQRQAILNASPTEVILKLYDFAIQACYKKEENRLFEVIEVLKNSLNHEYEISGSLHELYNYCQKKTREQKFDEVRELLEPVRSAWYEGVVKGGEKISSISKKGIQI